MTPDDRLARWLADPEGEPGPEAAEDLRRQLASEAVWADPDRESLERILADIRRERLSRPDAGPSARPRARLLLAVAAALVGATAILAAVGLFPPRSRPADHVVRLDGTERAPDASAVVTVVETPAGVALTFDLRQLPPAPPGYFYEGWVRGPRGRVSIGTFHLRGGDDSVELWSGVLLEEYPMVAVTLEPEDGDETSSGEVVLQGELT